jgi:hypothetical protein
VLTIVMALVAVLATIELSGRAPGGDVVIAADVTGVPNQVRGG